MLNIFVSLNDFFYSMKHLLSLSPAIKNNFVANFIQLLTKT